MKSGCGDLLELLVRGEVLHLDWNPATCFGSLDWLRVDRLNWGRERCANLRKSLLTIEVFLDLLQVLLNLGDFKRYWSCFISRLHGG
jgi:hypothetical protein